MELVKAVNNVEELFSALPSLSYLNAFRINIDWNSLVSGNADLEPILETLSELYQQLKANNAPAEINRLTETILSLDEATLRRVEELLRGQLSMVVAA